MDLASSYPNHSSLIYVGFTRGIMASNTLFYIPQKELKDLDLDDETDEDSDEDDDEDGYPEYSSGMIRDSFTTVQDFNEYLDDYFFTLTNKEHPAIDWTGTPGTDLHMIAGVTDLSQEELIEALTDEEELTWDETIEYGPSVTLLLDNASAGTGAYLAHNAYNARDADQEQAKEVQFNDDAAKFGRQNGVFIFYSNLPKKEYVDDPLSSQLRKVKRTSRLHVSSRHLVTVINDYVNNVETKLGDPPECSEIIFKRPPGSSVPSKIGESTKRTMNYYGDDAAQVVDHLTDKFGVNVDSVDFELASIEFKINRNAIIKLKSGGKSEDSEHNGPVTRLFDTILRKICDDTVGIKNAYANAESDTEEVLSGTVSVSQPAVVQFESPIRIQDIESVFDQLAINGIVPVDRYTEPEPLYYATSVYHRRYQEYFDIRGDSDSLRLFPRDDERNIESLFSVFDTLQRRLDSDISVTSHETNHSEVSQ
jgi:hypothetical protein